MFYIGLDVGTSSLKTTVMNEQKQIMFEESYDYQIEELEEGYREIDPNVWFQAVMRGLKDIFAQIDCYDGAMIGVSGQMHTTVFLDKNGKCVRKAIMWNDLRSASMIKELKEELKTMKETSYIARIISTGSPATNMLWMKANEPKAYAKVAKIMSAYDYIVYRLTGKYSLDYCDASTSSFYDIVHKKWSSYMLNKTGVKEEMLGPIHASCDIVGEILPCHRKVLNITKPVSVIAGSGDNPASAVAMGILHKKTPVISLGTSGVVIMPKKDLDFDGLGKNVLFVAHDEFVNIVQGSVRSAGGTHKWWVENIVEATDMEVDQDKIHKKALGKNKVMFFPHITGDKLIYGDIEARGAFIGLSPHTKRVDMTQAVFEGVSFALKEVLDGMQVEMPTRIQINGGGSKSDIWMEIMANILNCELEVVSMNATPSYGVCLMAYEAIHKEEKVQVLSKGKIFKPCKEIANAYAKRYPIYKQMYLSLKDITSA